MTTMSKTWSTDIEDKPTQDEAMARLAAAAEVSDPHDASAFVKAYKEMAWTTRSAEDFAQAVRWALWVGAYLIARDVAMAGAARYPDHAELQKMAYILAPPKVTVSKSGPHPDIEANRKWLKANWDAYRGHWVALKDGQLLGVADSLDALVEQIGEIKNTGILVTSLW
jgi:hypothetical protein